jgi:gliding motility-associated-like protein
MNRFLSLLLLWAMLFFNVPAHAIDPPNLIRVTIDTTTQFVNLYWSASPGAIYYEVQNIYTSGYNTWAGVLVGTSTELHYAYYEPDVFTRSVGYYVVALKDKLTYSNFSNIDSTIYLKPFFDSCSATIRLQWNDYNTWHGNILRHEVYQSIGSGPYQLYGAFLQGINQTTINVNADQNYRFYVVTTRDNGSHDLSFSNKVLINTKMAIVPAKINADFGTVADNQPFVKFTIDTPSELTNYILLRSNLSTGPFDSIVSFHTSDKIIEFHDKVDASKQPYYYRLKALNFCKQDARVSDNTASTIFFQAKIEGTAVLLNWTSYQNWQAGVAAYQVQRALNGGDFEVIASLNDLNYEDNSVTNMIGNNIGSEICYRIVATDGSGSQFSSTSNVLCVDLPVNVRFDFNAFQPGSANNGTFGPKLDFIPKDFSFKIFNRWGSKIFETHDPLNPRWDGHYSGSIVPEGVYRYDLEYKNENGKTILLFGDVTVVYP